MRENCVYTVKEIAKILKVSEKTLYNLIKTDDIAVVRVRGQIRITSQALTDYLQQGGMPIEKGNKRDPDPKER